MSLAKKLVTLRKRNGLTQLDLADKLNVSRQAISRWEVGAAVPSTDNLKILSELYNVSVDDILKGEVVGTSKSPDASDMSPEEQTSRGKHQRGKIVFFCVLILSVLAAFIVSSIVRSQGREEKPELPMESMPVEEEEDSAGTFSFE
uniref:helix-turn-helix transcriptional regulator n=1 Tax=Agathobacter sp. TaxID=2021311 RepID=UPI004057176C